MLRAVEQAGTVLSRGARRLFEVLHATATVTARTRGYVATVSRVVLHLPAILVAFRLGITDRHVRRLTAELERAGLLDAGGHAARVKGRTLYGGTLYAVRMREHAPAPRLTPDDWQHEWRDLEGDLDAGRTAAQQMSELQARHASEDELQQALEAWAVTPGHGSLPLDVVRTSPAQSVQDVVYTLPGLLDAPPRQRTETVGRLAATLARALSDEHSRRWYCRLIWNAITSEMEGRGGLRALANAVQRVLIDCREWSALRNPGALLNARWRAD